MNRVVIIGGGNSVSEGIDKGLWEKIKGQDIWSLNFAYLTMPYLPSRQLWVDKKFFQNDPLKMQELSKQGVRLDTKVYTVYRDIKEINTHVVYRFPEELEKQTEKDLIYIGAMGLCGTFALGLAVKEGYEEIFLCGYDFGNNSIDNKQTHYYQGKIDVKSAGVGDPKVYREKKEGVEKIIDHVQDFKYYLDKSVEKGFKIYNVSLNSNIDYFEKIGWDVFFNKIEKNQ